MQHVNLCDHELSGETLRLVCHANYYVTHYVMHALDISCNYGYKCIIVIVGKFFFIFIENFYSTLDVSRVTMLWSMYTCYDFVLVKP